MENRNKLIEKYDIKCNCNTPKFIEKEIEKMTKDRKYLLINSSYNNTNTNKYQKSGWSEIYKIYSRDSSSYIKIFPTR